MRHFQPHEIPEQVAKIKQKKDLAYKFIEKKGLWQEFQRWQQVDNKAVK